MELKGSIGMNGFAFLAIISIVFAVIVTGFLQLYQLLQRIFYLRSYRGKVFPAYLGLNGCWFANEYYQWRSDGIKGGYELLEIGLTGGKQTLLAVYLKIAVPFLSLLIRLFASWRDSRAIALF
jgi:hypothetical protein